MKQSFLKMALKNAISQLIWDYAKWVLFLGLIGYFLLSGIYKLEQNKIGVLTRFGRVVEKNVPPGLHYKLPWPIDRIYKVGVKEVKTITIHDFGSRYKLKEGGKSYGFYNATNLEPYCITGDNNIVAISVVLKYTIDNPVNYLFGMKEPERFVERSAANLIVHQLAHLKIDEVLTYGKKQFEFNLQKKLVTILDNFNTGIRISFLEIKEINPPRKVQDSFNRVINAEMNKKKGLNKAQGYYNRIVPAARSEANRLIQEAKGYKREKILTAEGESSRFLSRYKGYQENPVAHREKMYLEFVKKLYPTFKEIRVIDSENKDTSIILPFAQNN